MGISVAVVAGFVNAWLSPNVQEQIADSTDDQLLAAITATSGTGQAALKLGNQGISSVEFARNQAIPKQAMALAVWLSRGNELPENVSPEVIAALQAEEN